MSCGLLKYSGVGGFSGFTGFSGFSAHLYPSVLLYYEVYFQCTDVFLILQTMSCTSIAYYLIYSTLCTWTSSNRVYKIIISTMWKVKAVLTHWKIINDFIAIYKTAWACRRAERRGGLRRLPGSGLECQAMKCMFSFSLVSSTKLVPFGAKSNIGPTIFTEIN